MLSVLAPSHWAPPKSGAGFVQDRVLCFIPGPHSAEQLPQTDQTVQPPSTGEVKELQEFFP